MAPESVAALLTGLPTCNSGTEITALSFLLHDANARKQSRKKAFLKFFMLMGLLNF
jgi:hypothetical protein